MGILDESSVSGQTKQEAVATIKKINSEIYNELLEKHKSLYIILRNNPVYGQEEIIEEFGEDKSKLIEFLVGLLNLIMVVNPDYRKPDGF